MYTPFALKVDNIKIIEKPTVKMVLGLQKRFDCNSIYIYIYIYIYKYIINHILKSHKIFSLPEANQFQAIEESYVLKPLSLLYIHALCYFFF